MSWEIETSRQVADWLEGLDESTFDQILPALNELEEVARRYGVRWSDTSRVAVTNIPNADDLYDRHLAGETI